MPKQIEGVFEIFIIATLASCIASGIWIGDGFVAIVNTLAGFHSENFAVGGGLSVPTGIKTYWTLSPQS